MNPKSAREKGKRLEKFIIQQLEETGVDDMASRTPGSGSGKRKGDIWTKIGWTIEAKHEKHPQWWKNIDQAKEQAKRSNFNMDNWVLILNDPRQAEFQSVYAVIDFWKLLELIKLSQNPISKEPDREMKYNLEKLKSICNALLKRL